MFICTIRGENIKEERFKWADGTVNKNSLLNKEIFFKWIKSWKI